MINLLEQEQKKVIKRDYLLRVYLGYGLALLLLQLIVLVVLFSLYRGLSIEKNVMTSINGADRSTSEAKAYETYLANVRSSNKMASLIGVEKKKITEMTFILDKIIANRPSGVQIRSFEFVSAQNLPTEMKIKGVYAKRAGLALFSENLEKEKIVKSVYSPFANLIKEQNGEFAISLGLSITNAEQK